MVTWKKKHKRQAGAIYARDVIFGTLVHDAEAKVVAEQGIVFLYVKEAGHPYLLPDGVYIGYEDYGTEVDVTIRDITDEIILELGEDDFYEQEADMDDRLLLVDNWHEVQELYNECKIQAFTRNAKSISTFFAGLVLSGVCAWLYLKPDFPFPIVPLVGVPVGLLLAVFMGLIPTISLIQRLNTKVICDGANNYINVETGETNLNGGMTIPIREGVYGHVQ